MALIVPQSLLLLTIANTKKNTNQIQIQTPKKYIWNYKRYWPTLFLQGRLLFTLAAPIFLLKLSSLSGFLSRAKNKTLDESQLKVAEDLKEVENTFKPPPFEDQQCAQNLWRNTSTLETKLHPTMGKLKNGVKSSWLWQIISLWMLTQKFQNFVQSSLNSPKN